MDIMTFMPVIGMAIVGVPLLIFAIVAYHMAHKGDHTVAAV
jgi:predicted PurR-regulated permease PerM